MVQEFLFDPKIEHMSNNFHRKTTFPPIGIFSIPFLESYLLDQDILYWQQKKL